MIKALPVLCRAAASRTHLSRGAELAPARPAGPEPRGGRLPGKPATFFWRNVGRTTGQVWRAPVCTLRSFRPAQVRGDRTDALQWGFDSHGLAHSIAAALLTAMVPSGHAAGHARDTGGWAEV